MDLSLWTSFPRLLVFYAAMLLVVFPVMHLFDRVFSRKRGGAAKRSE